SSSLSASRVCWPAAARPSLRRLSPREKTRTTTRARSTDVLAEGQPVTLDTPTDRRSLALAIEVTVLLAIVLMGLCLRVDGLMILPRLTDETEEIRLGLRVARGEFAPLVGVKPYIGG